ncbi:phage tail protein [Salmonella enterica]|nr:phage tail protein [Salmonella enterica]EGJ1399946.1 phage tail protein [Salmonella enterica]ELE3307579.1 phage tail protein [Salmonella enterica subsp. enterica serovar Newmexico]
MTVKYYAILTNQGAARLANATMLGSKLNLTQMAVGDANGVLPTPDPAQTKLINQKRIAPLNLLSVDPNNQSQIIAEQIIPENEGGFWIREIGLYDDEGVLIAVANCPETYKPQLQEGSGRTQTIRMILVVTNTEAITLKIDPSVVLATRKYVDDKVLELKLYVDDQMRNHIAAQDPHTQYAQKHNPTFTGEPKAPTPAAGNNTTRIATTEFVQAAITALINGAPATLDTLKEIAAAINNDPKFSATINNALSGKQPLDETLTHLSGKDVAGLLAYLGLRETINLAKNAVPATRRVNNKPLSGDITLSAADVRAISADAVGEITDNSTMASANTPGWWRVAVSNSDTVTDFPTYPDGSKLYSYGYMLVEKIGEVWFQHYYAHMGANAKRQDWGTEPNTSRPWIIDYNTANKPSAGDVGALPITGGRLNGSLGIGTDNALGGNSIVFGDNDTGFKWHSDGVLGLYANNALVGYIDNSGLHMSVDVLTNGILRAGNGKTLTLSSGNNSAMNASFSLWGNGTDRPTVIELSDDQGWHFYSQRRQDGGIELSVNGNIYPANYSNFDARYLTSGNVYTKGESDNRYVQNIQRGAPVWPGKVDEYGPAEAPAGCFLTQARHDPTTAYGVTFAYRPLQMWVGNGWRTING